MKHALRLSLGLLALLILASCGQDPRKEAKAYEIRAAADSQSASDELQRQQAAELHALELQRQQAELERIQAAQPERIAAYKLYWETARIVGAFALALVILAAAVSLARVSHGLATVTVEAASLRANLIPLDRVTRQYPLLRHVHGSRYMLNNPNTGSVLMLDTQRDEDRQMIAAMQVTQLAGVIGQEARQSADPGALGMMQPPIVHAQAADISVGGTYLTQGE